MLYRPLYNFLEFQLVVFRDYITTFFKKEWIRFFISFIRAFILFVLKKNKSLKLCVDYKSFNKITIKNQYFLLLINKILNRFISI